MIIATNVYTVNSENRDAIIAEMVKASAYSRKVEGVFKHSYYVDLGDPNIIRFYGEFENIEAVNTLHSRQHFKDFKEAVKALGVTTSDGVISMHTPLP